jgi:hypothetical protein
MHINGARDIRTYLCNVLIDEVVLSVLVRSEIKDCNRSLKLIDTKEVRASIFSGEIPERIKQGDVYIILFEVR